MSDRDTSSSASAKTSRWRRPGIIVSAVAMGALSVLFGRQLVAADEPVEAEQAEPARDVPRYEAGEIRFSASYAKRIGLETVPVETHEIAPVVEVTGEVELSPEHVAVVGTRIFGRVEDVHVVPGQTVNGGQPLATLESAELGAAQSELLAARARERLAESENDRKALLVREGIAAHRSAEHTRKELEAARAHRQALLHRVKAMGGSTRSRRDLGEFTLRSPIEGEVIEVNVSQGEAVQPSHRAFRVADMTSLWIDLAVFEADLSRLSVGDDVVVHPTGDPSREVRGKIEHVGSVIDPQSRNAPVRVMLDNQDRLLRVGQSVRARITARGARTTALAIPHEAVVSVDGSPTVFVWTGPGRAVPRGVEVGTRGHALVAIESGLEEGERVVTEGVFELKSELFR